MEELENLLKLANDCADINGHDLFNVALISSIEDYVRYKKERDEKEQTLQKLRDEYIELERVNNTDYHVSEPFFYSTKHLSLMDIIEYAQTLESNDDIKTIQIMLYKLLAKHCSADELDMIGNITPTKHAAVNYVFHDHSQYVKTVKKQNINHGRDNNL